MAFYTLAGMLAWWGLTARRWRWLFLLAVVGVAFSGYLTAVALVALEAACLWCLTSAALTVAILGATWWRRPGAG
jgi:uncharacterized membrane protein